MIVPSNLFQPVGKSLSSFTSAVWRAFDIRDIFVFGGLGMLGYGLYLQWGEWLALVTCGPLLMILGYLMKAK